MRVNLNNTKRSGPLRAVRVFGLLAALMALVASIGGTAGAQAPTGDVTVVHGLRGFLVDIYLDGELALEAFEPDRLTEALPIPAGDHTVDLRPAGTDPEADPKATGTLTVPEGSQLAAVAHFTTDGEWTMSVFDKDLTEVPAGQTRVVFHNTSARSDVEIDLNGEQLIGSLEHGKRDNRVLSAATYEVSVLDPSDDSVVLPAQEVNAAAGTANFLYLVTSPDSTGATWLSENLRSGAAAPTRVAAGNSGLADPSDSGGRDAMLLVAVGLVGLTIAVVSTRRVRSRSEG